MLDIHHIITSGGLLLIGLIVFAESGLLVGFFLPGDTLLFSAGFFTTTGRLPLLGLIIVVVLAAIIGDNVGYTIGQHTGHRIFKKKDGILFRNEYLVRAEKFYEKHGGKMVLFARFVPIVRTFAPVVAGAGHMPRKRFVFFDIIGAVLWGAGIILLGHWLGSKIPNIDRYIFPVILAAMVLSFGPTIWHVVGNRETRTLLLRRLRVKHKK
ncbi:MAG: VTT domain-containing protein [Candidatus Saccharimonadales bacterium]